ncbi:Uncharacterised protein [Mycobacteroides abscessus subsp. abscessus]|uniref:hypothetical protein n=1 Tax=Mycobacteroides abscessus TaxID=36809 RepID=UPI0009265CF3|nr:hypothetical protein [Mycobacteroides abscessus]SHY08084.1 Uncharacterised protein [Mycobacteroides abscessus subsp. abscessus]SIC75757.1 Uncharacterised protein [Mycobacteroides abscessus subsp. abscessus]SKP28521.1 Uncharacterised protein [Mycobacteroides abscessus subsp. abscessus]
MPDLNTDPTGGEPTPERIQTSWDTTTLNVVPDTPASVYDRADNTARQSSLQLINNMLADPESHQIGGVTPIADIDPDDLDISRSLRHRLTRAKQHGYVIPETRTKIVPVPGRHPGRISEHVFDYPADIPYENQITDKTRGQSFGESLRPAVGPASFGLALGGMQYLFSLPPWVNWTAVGLTGYAALGFIAALLTRRRNLVYGLSRSQIIELHRALIAQPRNSAREERLTAIAASLIDKLTGSIAWKSGYLDVAHALFNPGTEYREIRSFAAKIAQTRTRLGTAPEGEGPDAQRARTHHAQQLADLDHVFDVLVARVAALHHYTLVIGALSEKITALQSIERSLVTGHEIDDLAHEIGANELAITRYDQLIADAQGLHSDITMLASSLAEIDNTTTPSLEARHHDR